MRSDAHTEAGVRVDRTDDRGRGSFRAESFHSSQFNKETRELRERGAEEAYWREIGREKRGRKRMTARQHRRMELGS